jgi:hypothetical protein
MMSASSSGDHFDCFLAGDSAVWAGCRRLAGTDAGALAVRGGADGKGVEAATGIVPTEAGGRILEGKADVVVTEAASSSSWGFKSSEISTLAGG